MKRDQIPLFEMESLVTMSVDERVDIAVATIRQLFEEGIPCCVAFSGGKDASTVADLTLTAARLCVGRTKRPPLVIITTSDTMAENPEIAEHYLRDMQKMVAYGAKHGFRVITRIAKPALLSTWQLKVLSGRGLPSFPGSNTDCSVDLKVTPQARLRKQIYKELQDDGLPEFVTLLGTRYLESEVRAMKMTLRGENADKPVRNADGDLILAPIAMWPTDDVFEFLATRPAGGSYSNFEDTLRIYAHSEGQGCAIVASVIEEGMSKSKKGGCGTRHGCHVCQQAVDKSLENMIAYDPRYEYAAGLNKLNKFIRNTRYDWRRRHWIGRTIKAGYIAIQPDTYHPSMVREIFRYMIQLQHDEQVRARRSGQRVKFTLFSQSMILALDAYWSLAGLAKPFSAWADVDDITSDRVRYDVPEVEPIAPQEIPAARFLYVGAEWDDSAGANDMTGLRDAYLESLLEISACGPDLKQTRGGKTIWDLHTKETSFTVNPESVAMFEDFEMHRLLEQYRRPNSLALPGSITHGYKWYLQYGAIQVTPAQSSKHDEMLRRTAHKDSLGLTTEYDIDALLSQSIRFSDLPTEARHAWSKKATMATAQPDLC